MAICSSRRGVLGSVYCLVVVLSYARICLSARSDNEIRERFYGNLVNSSVTGTGEGSIAKMFDRVLEKEFSENDQTEGLPFFSLFIIFICWNPLIGRESTGIFFFFEKKRIAGS